MFPIAETAEAICLLIAVICLRKRTDFWLLFIPYLALTLIVELTGRHLMNRNISNHRLYNYFLPIQVFFELYIVHKILPHHPFRKTAIAIAAILFGGIFIWESTSNAFRFYNYQSDAVSCVIFIILSGWYFYLLMKDEQPVTIRHFAPFWFVSGVFLFCFGSMTVVLFSETIMNLFVAAGLSVRSLVYTILNLLLYGFWTYAFVCKYRETI